MNTEQAKKFFDNLYRDIWQEGSIEKFPYYYHQDVLITLGNNSLNYSQIKERALQQQKIGKRMSYNIVDIVAESDLVALHIDVYDYLEKNLKVMGFFHFKEGKIHDVITVSRLIIPA